MGINWKRFAGRHVLGTLVFLLTAQTSGAAIAIDPSPAANGPTGELFISVYDSVTGVSYTRDLGVFAVQSNFYSTAYSFEPDALYTSTFGESDPDNIRYSIVGLASINYLELIEVWTTTNDSDLTLPGAPIPAMFAIRNGIQDYIQAVNMSIPTTDIFANLSTINSDPSSAGHYTNPATFGESLASVVTFNIAAPIGTPLRFRSLTLDPVIAEPVFIAYPWVWTLNVDGSITYAPRVKVDTDEDGVRDLFDNCIDVSNPAQTDSDGDLFGNACDADLNNDCTTNVVDLGLLRAAFFGPTGPADFNDDGAVNFVDLGILRTSVARAPGPSAFADCSQ